MSKKKDQPNVTNVYHIHGNNPRWNTNSTDNSLNVVITSHDQVFADLRKQIESSIPAGDEQKDVLEKLTALEQARESRSFGKRYAEFISAAANHMTLIAPFIPALTEMLQKTLYWYFPFDSSRVCLGRIHGYWSCGGDLGTLLEQL